MTINTQTLITAVAVIGALIALYKYFAEAVRFMDRQKIQDEEIKLLKQEVENKETALKSLIESAQSKENDEIEKLRNDVNAELMVVNYGLLACLKGLAEQGCDGAVHDAISKLEKHLNQKAHQ